MSSTIQSWCQLCNQWIIPSMEPPAYHSKHARTNVAQFETVSVSCNDCHQTLYYGATPPKAHLEHIKADAERRQAADEKAFQLANNYGVQTTNRGNFVPVPNVIPSGMVVHEKIAQKLVSKRKESVPEHTGINRELSDLIRTQIEEDKN